MVKAQQLDLLARRDTFEHERHVVGHPAGDAHVVGDRLALRYDGLLVLEAEHCKKALCFLDIRHRDGHVIEAEGHGDRLSMASTA